MNRLLIMSMCFLFLAPFVIAQDCYISTVNFNMVPPGNPLALNAYANLSGYPLIDVAGTCNCTGNLTVNAAVVQTVTQSGVANNTYCSVNLGNSSYWTNGDTVSFRFWVGNDAGDFPYAEAGPYLVENSVFISTGGGSPTPEDTSGGGSLSALIESWDPPLYPELELTFTTFIYDSTLDTLLLNAWNFLGTLFRYILREPATLAPTGAYMPS
jgi:hypothetical protein